MQFLTFRLVDAVPAEIVAAWKTELKLSGGEAADDPRCARLRRRIERYADQGHGACWLKDDRVAEVVRDALLHFDGERYRLLAWVIMPNHVHAVIEILPGFPLDGVIHSWKSFTSKRVNRLSGRTGAFWMGDYFDRYVRDEAHLWDVMRYMEENPRNKDAGETPALPGGRPTKVGSVGDSFETEFAVCMDTMSDAKRVSRSGADNLL